MKRGRTAALLKKKKKKSNPFHLYHFLNLSPEVVQIPQLGQLQKLAVVEAPQPVHSATSAVWRNSCSYCTYQNKDTWDTQ